MDIWTVPPRPPQWIYDTVCIMHILCAYWLPRVCADKGLQVELYCAVCLDATINRVRIISSLRVEGFDAMETTRMTVQNYSDIIDV